MPQLTIDFPQECKQAAACSPAARPGSAAGDGQVSSRLGFSLGGTCIRRRAEASASRSNCTSAGESVDSGFTDRGGIEAEIRARAISQEITAA